MPRPAAGGVAKFAPALLRHIRLVEVNAMHHAWDAIPAAACAPSTLPICAISTVFRLTELR